MKNKKFILSLTLLAVFCVSEANAKLFSFGLKGGLTLSSLSLNSNFKENFSTDNRTGFFVGPVVQINVPLGFAVNAAVMYSQDNIKYTNLIGDVSDKRRMIEIPINLKWKFSFAKVFGIYAEAGPDFIVNINNGNKIRDYISETYAASGGDPSKVINETETFSVGINIGAGVILFDHLNVGANYIFPLKDTYKFSIDGGLGEISSKDKRWQISVAYMF